MQSCDPTQKHGVPGSGGPRSLPVSVHLAGPGELVVGWVGACHKPNSQQHSQVWREEEKIPALTEGIIFLLFFSPQLLS